MSLRESTTICRAWPFSDSGGGLSRCTRVNIVGLAPKGVPDWGNRRWRHCNARGFDPSHPKWHGSERGWPGFGYDAPPKKPIANHQVTMSVNALYTDLSDYYDLMCADIDYQTQSHCIHRLQQLFGN